MQAAMNIVIFGLSITSSWGNGHATTFRSLIKALAARGHRITFFEKDVPWYAAHRDLPEPPFCATHLYQNLEELADYERLIAGADLAIIGSYVQDADALSQWLTRLKPGCSAFYDIDTPVTLAKLEGGDYEYLNPAMVPRFDLYLSFSGGPTLDLLERKWGAPRARALYCSVDPDLYYPEAEPAQSYAHSYALGYLGTYSLDRQPTVAELLLAPARHKPELRFCVAGAQYPSDIEWPANVETVEHIPPQQHRAFYNTQKFTLNVTRRDMIRAGYSPSVRLFEAGACATPVISDYWDGLGDLFELGSEILVARSRREVLDHLEMAEEPRWALGERLRQRVLAAHTNAHRARELESYVAEVSAPSARSAAH